MRLFLLVILVPTLLTACAAPRAITASGGDPIGSPPEDFSIDLTILAPATRPSAQPVHLRPSRLVLFADGSLHYGVDEHGRGADWLPGLTRRLSRDQMAQVWSLSRQLGMADPERGEEPVNFNLIQPQRRHVTYLAAFTAHHRRWSFIRTSPLSGEPDPAMAELARALAHLAWQSDPPQGSRTRRYDFGPDPYARYRR